jgi:hypothetical protein
MSHSLETAHVNSELHWQAYKEVVLASQDKSLELFVKEKVGGNEGGLTRPPWRARLVVRWGWSAR